MKFGNYNLTTATESHNRLFFSRLKKVKNTSNYIAGKFNNQINTIRQINIGKRKVKQPAESPLSFRASLFDDRKHLPQSEKCRELREKLEKFRTEESIYESCGSQKYLPSDFHRPSSSLFDNRKSPNELCVFDKVKFTKVNNAISGKRQHKMLKNVYFTIKSNKCGNNSNLYESMDFELRRDSMKKSYKFSPPRIDDEPKIKMDLTALLKAPQYDEKTELEILKNYFDSMSYSEICRDSDFKNYLKKKNYQDAIDYIYSGTSFMGSSLRGDKSSIYGAATDVLRRYYDLDLEIVKESNDCDSIKNEKQGSKRPPSVDRRKYYNKANSQFFCKSNKQFDDYYKKNTNIFYEATKTVDDDFFQKDSGDFRQALFYDVAVNDDESLIDELYGHKSQPYVYSTMPTRKVSKSFDDNCEISFHPNADGGDDSSEFHKYQTYPLKKKAKQSYEQLLKYCEKTLSAYATIDLKMEKWQKLSKKEFSEKTYSKIVKAFVRLRGFESVELYIQYHYGRILDKSFDSHLKEKLKDALSRHDEQLVISHPILRTTTQSAVAANNRLDSMPPPYTSGSFESVNNYFYKRHGAKTKARDDYFKHYDYIDVRCDKALPSSVDGNEPAKRVLFKCVEDMREIGIDFDEIIAGGGNMKSEIRQRDAPRNHRASDRACYNTQSKFDRKLSELGKRSVDNIYESIRGEAFALPSRALHKHHNQKCVEKRRARETTQNVIYRFSLANGNCSNFRQMLIDGFSSFSSFYSCRDIATSCCRRRWRRWCQRVCKATPTFCSATYTSFTRSTARHSSKTWRTASRPPSWSPCASFRE